MVHVKKSIFIRAPMERVYALVRDPNSGAIWFPGKGELKEVTGEGGVGTVTKYSYTMEGTRFTVHHKVVEDHIGPEGARWKGEFGGPLPGEHTWIFVPKNGDTEVRVDVRYTVSEEALDAVPVRRFIERTQERRLGFALDNVMMWSQADQPLWER